MKRFVGMLQRTDVSPVEKFFRGNTSNFFFDKDDLKINDRDIQDWAVCLNSPWRDEDKHYEISFNAKKQLWESEFIVIGYDMITSSVIGYGDTEVKALIECKKLFEEVQRRFNPDGESF